MKRKNILDLGLDSLFHGGREYPKPISVEEGLRRTWCRVGENIQHALDQYGEEESEKNKNLMV